MRRQQSVVFVFDYRIAFAHPPLQTCAIEYGDATTRVAETEAAHKLQLAGLIAYRRGHIKVLDRPALEKRSCECYAVVKHEYDRLLPATLAV